METIYEVKSLETYIEDFDKETIANSILFGSLGDSKKEFLKEIIDTLNRFFPWVANVSEIKATYKPKPEKIVIVKKASKNKKEIASFSIKHPCELVLDYHWEEGDEYYIYYEPNSFFEIGERNEDYPENNRSIEIQLNKKDLH